MEKVKKYSWKYGNGNGVSADVVGRQFEAIEQENGVLTKEAVVDSARPEDSPLHPMFEWNDKIAGEKYRLEQARKYIACLAVKVVPVGLTSGATIKTRGYYNVSPINAAANQPEGIYVNVDSVINSPDKYMIVLARAKRELAQFRNKYDSFKELRPVMIAIDKVMEKAI